MSRRRQAGGDGRAATAGYLVGEVEGAHRARHLEGVLDTALHGLADLVCGVGRAGVEGVGRAELAGKPELLVREIDRDDPARPRGDGAEDRAQADAAEAD